MLIFFNFRVIIVLSFDMMFVKPQNCGGHNENEKSEKFWNDVDGRDGKAPCQTEKISASDLPSIAQGFS